MHTAPAPAPCCNGKPRWRTPATPFSLARPSAQNVVVQNLTFDTLNPNPDSDMPDAIAVGGDNITVRNNTFLNIGDCVNANSGPGRLARAGQLPAAGGRDVVILRLVPGENGVIIGNTSVNSTRQHNIRASYGFSQLLIEDNNLQNLDRSTIDPGDTSKNTINMQYGSFIYVSGNTVADGSLRIGPLDANEIDEYPTTALSERETWVVVEDNTVNNTEIEVHPGTVNAVVRNNVVNENDLPGIYIYGYDPTYNNMVQNVSFLNNTVVTPACWAVHFTSPGKPPASPSPTICTSLRICSPAITALPRRFISITQTSPDSPPSPTTSGPIPPPARSRGGATAASITWPAEPTCNPVFTPKPRGTRSPA